MIVLPTPFPPLLTLRIGPSPEQGQKEKPKKTNVNKHVHFAASQQLGERIPCKIRMESWAGFLSCPQEKIG